ncbi:MAG: alpha/beta hydrolase [Hyphomonadaceae bacterium]|nr:alpha/beta hydrolase [Hyphomonadaceae bacterium]
MTTRRLVDPQLLPLLDAMPPVTMSPETLPAMRARIFPFEEDPAHVEKVEIFTRSTPGLNGAPDVGLVIARPRNAAAPLPAILHMHGGGYVAGTAAQFAPHCRAIAAETDSLILSVDYRLAPETPYPGPIEDCYAALAWLFANAADLGIDRTRIGVMGESAGGGLAAALALMARDRGEYRFAFQHLIYPMIDDRTCAHPDPHPYAGEFIWNPGSNAFGWMSLLGPAMGADNVSPYAAAARATDLTNLPPTFIACGALDLFLEENLDYARRLTRAGVPVELHIYPGAFHGFQRADAVIARNANRDRIDALRRALHP